MENETIETADKGGQPESSRHGNKRDTSSSPPVLPMDQSSKSPSRTQLKAMVAVVIIAFAALGGYFFLSTETGCTYQNNPGGPTHNGQQTYWAKLVGGVCNPLPVQSPATT